MKSSSLKSSGFILSVTLLLTITLLSILVISAIKISSQSLDDSANAIDAQYRKQHHLMNMNIAGQLRTVALGRLILEEDEFIKDETLMRFYGDEKNYAEHRDQLTLLARNEYERELLQEIQDMASSIGPVQDYIAKLAVNDGAGEAKKIFLTQSFEALDRFNQKVTEFSLYQANEVQKSIQHAKQTTDTLIQTIIILAAGLVLLISFFTLILARRFKRINTFLQKNNQSLEQKVQVRTRQLTKTQEYLIERNTMLEELSTTDSLTQLCNRLKVEQVLRDLHRQFVNNGNHYCVLLIDLDSFKKINDTYGHTVGDQVLKEFAELLKVEFDGSPVGRWGGEEFIVVLNDSDSQQAFERAEQFRLCVQEQYFTEVGKITQSSGIACIQDGENNAALIHRADQALYTSKNNGRNQVTVADAEHCEPLNGTE